MTEAERQRFEHLSKQYIFFGDEHRELERLRDLDERERLGPEGYAAKQREREARAASIAAARARREAAERATVQALQRLRPVWAKALILAESNRREPDRDMRTVALAWSRHTRDLFPELYAAAATFPETAHLTPACGRFDVSPALKNRPALRDAGTEYVKRWVEWVGSLPPYPDSFPTRAAAEAFVHATPLSPPADLSVQWEIMWECNIEHREKYTGGGGYYLEAREHPWRVSKTSLAWLDKYPQAIELDLVQHGGRSVAAPGVRR